jgi:hypothetical protein
MWVEFLFESFADLFEWEINEEEEEEWVRKSLGRSGQDLKHWRIDVEWREVKKLSFTQLRMNFTQLREAITLQVWSSRMVAHLRGFPHAPASSVSSPVPRAGQGRAAASHAPRSCDGGT